MLIHMLSVDAALMVATVAALYRWKGIAEDNGYEKNLRGVVRAFRTSNAARAAILGYTACGMAIVNNVLGL